MRGSTARTGRAGTPGRPARGTAGTHGSALVALGHGPVGMCPACHQRGLQEAQRARHGHLRRCLAPGMCRTRPPRNQRAGPRSSGCLRGGWGRGAAGRGRWGRSQGRGRCLPGRPRCSRVPPAGARGRPGLSPEYGRLRLSPEYGGCHPGSLWCGPGRAVGAHGRQRHGWMAGTARAVRPNSPGAHQGAIPLGSRWQPGRRHGRPVVVVPPRLRTPQGCIQAVPRRHPHRGGGHPARPRQPGRAGADRPAHRDSPWRERILLWG